MTFSCWLFATLGYVVAAFTMVMRHRDQRQPHPAGRDEVHELDLPWDDPDSASGEFCRVYVRIDRGHCAPSFVRVHAEWINQCGDASSCTDREALAALAKLTVVDKAVLP